VSQREIENRARGKPLGMVAMSLIVSTLVKPRT
jgi:hypothetical protein